MRRLYFCFSGQVKIIWFVGRGRMMKWRDDVPRGPSTVWYDEESDENYTIPDNAWTLLAIPYMDLNDKGERYASA